LSSEAQKSELRVFCVIVPLLVLLFSFASNFYAGFQPEETPRRRITVVSSFNEISTDQLGTRVVVRGGGGVTPSSPTSPTAGFSADI